MCFSGNFWLAEYYVPRYLIVLPCKGCRWTRRLKALAAGGFFLGDIPVGVRPFSAPLLFIKLYDERGRNIQKTR